MNFTGERPTKELGVESSLMRYKVMIPFVQEKTVLDYGCGCGFGTNFLSLFCKEIIGYDISQQATDEARKMFSNLIFATEILDYNNFDVIVMSELIEHLEPEEVPILISKMIGSTLIISTPNGNWFPYHPKNKTERVGFHTQHYTVQELQNLLKQYFSYVQVSAIIWDPLITQWTGLLAIATNTIKV